MTATDWQVIMRRYYEDLGRFTPETLHRACERARKVSPDWFPTLTKLEQIAIDVETTKIPRSRQLTEGKPFDDPEQAKAALAEIMAGLEEREANGNG